MHPSKRSGTLAWLVGVAAAMVACGHSPPRAARSSPRWDGSCLVRRGCPRAAPPPACSSDLTAVALADVTRRADALAGTRVAVAGPLRPGGGWCTALLCLAASEVQTRPGGLVYRYDAPAPGKAAGPPALVDASFEGDTILLTERGCCNSCAAGLSLGGKLLLAGPHLGCSGDESLMCCTVDAHDQPVVATGVLRRAGRVLVLDGATVCTR